MTGGTPPLSLLTGARIVVIEDDRASLAQLDALLHDAGTIRSPRIGRRMCMR